MVSKFNHDPTATHLVSYCPGSARACEAIQDEIAAIRCKRKNLVDKPFRLRSTKQIGDPDVRKQIL